MITEKKLINLISKSLKIDSKKLSINSNINEIEEWDSLGQLNILSKLDVILDGKTAKIKKLSECYSVNSIYKLLIKHKLLK